MKLLGRSFSRRLRSGLLSQPPKKDTVLLVSCVGETTVNHAVRRLVWQAKMHLREALDTADDSTLDIRTRCELVRKAMGQAIKACTDAQVRKHWVPRK